MKKEQENGEEKSKIPKEPKWETLPEKLKCRECRCKGCECNKNPKRLSQCSKRYSTIKRLICIISCIPNLIVMYIVFKKTSNIKLAVTITLYFMFLYDMLFLGLESIVTKYFTEKENARRRKYEKEVERIQKLKYKENELKKDENMLEGIRQQDVNNAIEQCEKFAKLAKDEVIIGEFRIEYKNMLNELDGICKILVPESFSSIQLKNLFAIYLPEVYNVCEDFFKQYKLETLTEREIQEFHKLLQKITEHLSMVKRKIIENDNIDLYVRITALTDSFKVKESEED